MTYRAAVLGHPIAHSLSPVLHRAAYDALGLADWRYDRFDVPEADFADFMAGLDEQWRGLSLTMPLKEIAFSVAGSVSPLARSVGSINTLVRTDDGGWAADNTDVAGVAAAIRGCGIGQVDRLLCLGAGATARSVLAAVAGMGARAVTFATRSGARPETLSYARSLGLAAAQVTLTAVPQAVAGHDLVVNTLPGQAAGPVAEMLSPGAVVTAGRPGCFDVVYAGWPTPLAQVFEAAGAPVSSGLDMLIHQAVRQVELMTRHTSTEAVLTAMTAAVRGR